MQNVYDNAAFFFVSNVNYIYITIFKTGQFIPDMDEDGIPDVLNTHGGDPFGEPGRFKEKHWLPSRFKKNQKVMYCM